MQPDPISSLVDSSLCSLWYAVVDRSPDAVAVRTLEGQSQTFRELDEASSRLANRILNQFGDPSFPVLLLLDQSPELIAAILGVIKANKLFVVLDPGQTAAYLRQVAGVTRAGLLLCDGANHGLARAVCPMAEPVWLLADTAGEAAQRPADGCTANSLAGLVFTSGSTGQPKGVIYPHKMLAHRVWCEQRLGLIGPGHRLAGLRHCGFSAGVADLFKALLSGAGYYLFPVQTQGVHRLSRWLQDEQITYLPLPVVLFRQWLETLLPSDRFSSLLRVYPSGRKLGQDAKQLWPHVGPDCLLLSTYGSTEASLMSLAMVGRTTQDPPGVLAVGQAVPGKLIQIVGSDGRPVQPGETGAIEIQSSYISPGYWRQPELTRQCFRSAGAGSTELIYQTGDLGRHRSNGSLELVGRLDSQVKVRGYRVELGALEDALQALPGVGQVVVALDEEKDRLLAYIVPVAGAFVTVSELKHSLAGTVPDYAVPAWFLVLDAFPMLASGKIDRQALPRPTQARPDQTTPFLAPRTTLEARLARIWAEILGIDEVGALDHFFELGGHSLLTMRLLMRVEQEFEVSVPLIRFFQEPTLERMGQLIAHAAYGTSGSSAAALAGTARDLDSIQSVADVLSQDPEFMRRVRPRFLAQNRNAVTRLAQACLNTLPPRLVQSLFSSLTGHRLCQARLFQEKLATLARYQQSVRPTLEPESWFPLSLQYYLIDRYRIGAPRQGVQPPWNGTGRTPLFLGVDALQAAARAGRGVVLVRTHDNARNWFPTLVISDYRVTDIRHVTRGIQQKSELDETALHVYQLDAARRYLAAGLVVEIHGDGYQGTSQGFEHDFHGRRRKFMAGFAELAVLTDALVYVVDGSFGSPGTAQFTVVGPLESGGLGLSHHARVELLVAQYVRYLAGKWHAEPWMVPFFEIAAYERCPEVGRSRG